MVNANCNTCGGLISGVINNCINSQPIKLCCCDPWYGCSSSYHKDTVAFRRRRNCAPLKLFSFSFTFFLTSGNNVLY